MTQATAKIGTPSSKSEVKPYDVLTRAFHWATAALVIVLYVLYITWQQVPKNDFKHLLIVSHLSLGAVLTVVLAGRLGWRSSSLSSQLAHVPGLQGLAARAMHLLLYALLIAQVLLGWNFRWAQGQSMSVFGVPVPSPFTYPTSARHAIATLHYWTGTALIALAVGHAAAALYHHLVLRDNVLRRMASLSPSLNKR